MSFRARWFVRLIVAVALGLLIVAGVILGPRIRRQWKRDELIRDLRSAPTRADAGERGRIARALVGFEGPEALLALIDDFRVAPSPSFYVGTEERLLEAVELFATRPEPRDPRPRAALEALAGDNRPTLRSWGLYLLEELENPTHAQEPIGFAPPWSLVRCDPRDPLAGVRAAARLPIEAGGLEDRIAEKFGARVSPDKSPALPEEPPGEDTPWRMLVRIAQRIDARVTVDGQRVRLVPRPHWVESGSDQVIQLWRVAEEVPSEPLVRLTIISPAVVLEGFRPIRFDTSRLDPEKFLRTLASLNSLRFVRRDSTKLEAYEALSSRERIARIVAAFAEGHFGLAECFLDHLEPEAFLALLDIAAGESSRRWTDSNEQTFLRACELFALTRSSDVRVAAALKKLETDEEPRRRFLARYMEEELRDPTFLPPPSGLVGKAPVTIPEGASLGQAIAVIASATGVRIAAEESFLERVGPVERAFVDEPWRALVRLAQSANALIAPDSDSLRLVARPRIQLGTLGDHCEEIPQILFSSRSRFVNAFRFALEGVAPKVRITRTLSLLRGFEKDELASEPVPLLFWDLARTETPDGCWGLAHLFGDLWPRGGTTCARALERSVRLRAGDAPDASVREALEELTASQPRVRFFGYYLLDLLEHPPTPAPPPAFAGSQSVVLDFDGKDRVSLADAVAPVVSVVGPILDISPRCANQTVQAPSFTDRPWRTLLRIALEANDTLVVEGERVRIEKGRRLWSGRPGLDARLSDLDRPVTVVPPASLKCPWSDDDDLRAIYGDLDPERALRALAKLNGCEVCEKDDGTLEVRATDTNGGH